MKLDRSLIGAFVRIEFVDHFRYNKLSSKNLLLNLEKYSKNYAVGDLAELTEDFAILRNSWSNGHELGSGIAIFRPAIKNVSVLSVKRAGKEK